MLAGVTFIVTAFAGCGTSHTLTSPTTASTIPVSRSGLTHSDARLTDRIVLTKARVPAGLSIHGTLVVTSRAPTPINLNGGCRPNYMVALANKHYQPAVAWASVCSSQPFIIRPGINRLPVTVFTTCLGCGQPGSPSMPFCVNHTVPNLPAGDYEAVLFGDGLPLPAATPLGVTLTSESSR
jgi:hypothetical protein